MIGSGLRDEIDTPMSIARAEGLVGSARGFSFDAVGEIWDSLTRGDPPSPR